MKLLSPVFSKEMVQLASGRSYFIVKLISAVVLLVATMLLLLLTDPADMNQTSQLGQMFFWVIALVQFLGFPILIPILMADVVCGERQARTLPLLFLTRLRPRHIVQDKGLSRLVSILYLAGLSFPFLFSGLLFGGVDTEMLVSACANLVAVILACGACSLLASAYCQRVVSALAVAYLLEAIVFIFAPILIGLSWGEHDVIPWLNPLVSLTATMYIFRAPGVEAYSWAGNLAWSFLFYLLAVGFGSSWLGSQVDDQPARQRKPTARTPRSRRERPVRGNPLAWRQRSFTGNRRVLAIVALITMALIVLVVQIPLDLLDSVRRFREGMLVLSGFMFPVVCLLVTILAASSIVSDRRDGSLDLLAATRLNGSQILHGYLRGVARYAIWGTLPLIVLLMLGHGAYFVFRGDVPPEKWQLVTAPLGYLVALAFGVMLGLTWSIRARTLARSLLLTFATIVVLHLLPLIVLLIVQDDVDWLIALMPAGGYVACFVPEDSEGAWLVAVVLYSALAGFMYWRLRQRMDSLLGRQP